jgi:dipeptidase D
VDIHLQRGNAIRLLARILDAGARGTTLHLTDIHGGNKHNAIPREAAATVVLGGGEGEGFRERAAAEYGAIRDALAPVDPDVKLDFDAVDLAGPVLDPDSSRTALHLLHALPHGVMAMSHDIPDLVETSTNLATVRTSDDAVEILMSSRSSVAGELRALRALIRATAHLAGADVHEEDGYPGWKPNLRSSILAVVKGVYADELGRQPRLKAIHAGLETGIIGQKVPGMDMVSIGPQIEFPHSPDERVRIPSVADFYRLLTTALERLA